MIETVTKPSIGALLDPEALVVFRIPRYQREYTWRYKDWENIFDDVMYNPLGLLMCDKEVIEV